MRKLLRRYLRELFGFPRERHTKIGEGYLELELSPGRVILDSEAMKDPKLQETIRELNRISKQQRPR